MNDSLKLTLALPPSINNQYVQAGRRRVLSSGAKTFKKNVLKQISGMREQPSWNQMLEQEIRKNLLGVYFTFYFETPLKRDLDGGLKIALDALAEAIGFDDRTVVDLHLTKQIDPLRPRLEVELEVIRDWSFDPTYVYLGEQSEDISG